MCPIVAPLVFLLRNCVAFYFGVELSGKRCVHKQYSGTWCVCVYILLCSRFPEVGARLRFTISPMCHGSCWNAHYVETTRYVKDGHKPLGGGYTTHYTVGYVEASYLINCPMACRQHTRDKSHSNGLLVSCLRFLDGCLFFGFRPALG